MLRLLGELALCIVQVGWSIGVITQLDSPWRGLAVAWTLLALLFAYRGMSLAVQDLRRPSTAPNGL